jgi:hypothetical protein
MGYVALMSTQFLEKLHFMSVHAYQLNTCVNIFKLWNHHCSCWINVHGFCGSHLPTNSHPHEHVFISYYTCIYVKIALIALLLVMHKTKSPWTSRILVTDKHWPHELKWFRSTCKGEISNFEAFVAPYKQIILHDMNLLINLFGNLHTCNFYQTIFLVFKKMLQLKKKKRKNTSW